MAFIWIGCFFLFCFVHVFIMAPQKRERRYIEARFIEKKRLYEFALNAIHRSSRNKLEKQIEEMKDKLGTFVVDFEDSADVTFDIRQLAAEKEIASLSVRAQSNRENSPTASCKYIDENRLNISFNAGFKQFATFLNALERNHPVVFVDDFKITRSNEGSWAHKINMNLAYFVKKQTGS